MKCTSCYFMRARDRGRWLHDQLCESAVGPGAEDLLGLLSEGMASGCWDRQARMDRRDRPDRTEPALANEQTESTEANEPTESTEANEPAEPMDRMEPADPTDRIDPEEPIDKMDPLEPMLKIDPVEPASRRERFPLRIGPFSQPAPKPAAAGHRTRGRRQRRDRLVATRETSGTH